VTVGATFVLHTYGPFLSPALAQVILLTVGYLHRIKSRYLFEFSKSSSFLHSVSNRLAASLPRARFLGMVIGVAISRLVDPSDQQMNFDAEELETQEADWWFSLVNIEDSMGSVEALKNLTIDRRGAEARLIPRKRKFVQAASSKLTSQIEASKIISIEEVDDVSESEDDLMPYQKPDEDPEDSDEDPTLINRSKPKAPIYINDLIKSLNVIDKPEVVEVALKTAPSLIRRKANFGTELSENIEVVASSLINLQEGLPNHDLQELRLQSLIACLVCQPGRMGPWFTSMYFEGDFSLSQRASLLTTIGLSSREVAGHKDEGTPSASHVPLPPSKELPPHLAAVYQSLDNLSNQIQHTTLRPMALAAADQATGPDILKIRTFSSRLAVEKRTNALALDRSRRIPKNLHKILAESIYLPLCCRMSLLFTSPSSFTAGGVGTRTAQAPSIKTNTLFDPHILKLFLQTLTITLTTLGPHAPQLPTVTRETLLLLTALVHRATASGLYLDAAVLPAMLTLLLTTLDVNVEAGTTAEERLVTDFGDMVAELVRWVGGLGESVRVPEVGMGGLVRGDEEEGMGMPWTVIAAGIQVKWAEVGRKFQGTMMGLVGGMGLDDF
jgi:telomere length regulation protein